MKKGILVAAVIICALYFLVIPKFFCLFISTTEVETDYETISRILESQNQTPVDVYYINLASSKDRNRRFISHLHHSLNPIRIEAVSPATLPAIRSPLLCSTVVATEYACLASHLKAIHRAYHDNKQCAIIAEDDALMRKNIDWQMLMDSAPADWEILQLHTRIMFKRLFNPKLWSLFDRKDNLWAYSGDIVPSCACYIIRRGAMRKLLLKYVVGYESPRWSDVQMLDFRTTKLNCQADLMLYHDMIRYLCTYPLIDIAESKSTIHWIHDVTLDYDHIRSSKLL